MTGNVPGYRIIARQQFAPVSAIDLAFCQDCGTVVHVMLIAAHVCPRRT